MSEIETRHDRIKTPSDSIIMQIVDAVWGPKRGIERLTTGGGCVCRINRCTRRGFGPMTPTEQIGDDCSWCNDWISKIVPKEEWVTVSHMLNLVPKTETFSSVEEAVYWLKERQRLSPNGLAAYQELLEHCKSG